VWVFGYFKCLKDARVLGTSSAGNVCGCRVLEIPEMCVDVGFLKCWKGVWALGTSSVGKVCGCLVLQVPEMCGSV